jgi:hypothetical protein
MSTARLVLIALLLGCNSDAGSYCDSSTLACAGTNLCCGTSTPILCGSSCWAVQPTTAECDSTVTVCSAASDTSSPCMSGSYCYEWICNGDSECLSTNPNGTATGANDEGNDASCDGLLMFGEQFWNIPPAWQACTLIP